MKNKLSFLIFTLAVLFYGNTLLNGYAYDDADLILSNSQVKRGISATGDIFKSRLRDGSGAVKNELYRPITKLVYALEWTLSPNNPAVGHLFNVLLYGLLCVLVFWVVTILFGHHLLPAFLAALLFAIHPIHTEVVANIKSIDEILGLLFFMACLLNLHIYLQSHKKKALAAAVLFYTLCLFSKESYVAFIVLIPLFIYYVAPPKNNQLLKTSLYFLAPLLVFFYIRSQIMGSYDHSKMIGKIDNFLIAVNPPSKRLATCIYMLGMYLRLLFIPYPLVCDYSFPQVPTVSFTNVLVLLMLVIFVVMLVFALKRLKNRHLLAFSILWLMATMAIASNIFFLIGTNFGERLLFAPSFAVCIAIAYLARQLVKTQELQLSLLKGEPWFSTLVLLVVLASGYVVLNRNREWKDTRTLIEADVEKNTNSARLHFLAANEWRNEIVAQKNSAAIQAQNLPRIKSHLSQALHLYPQYGSARFALAEYYMHRDSTRQALNELRQALYYLPTAPPVYNAIASCQLKLKAYDSTIVYLRQGLRFNPQHPELLAKYGSALFYQNKPDSAIVLLQQALAIDPGNVQAKAYLDSAGLMKKREPVKAGS